MMKKNEVNKKKITSLTRKGLSELGYVEINDSITGAQGLFIKSIKNGLFLSLGLTISRYYDCKFTGSFYLSKTTLWSAIWGDIPRDSYCRVGDYLTEDERKFFLSNEYSKESSKDSWWYLDEVNSINYFLNVVRISEERLLNQSDLLKRVQDSKDVNELAELAQLTIANMKVGNLDECLYKYIPSVKVDSIPLEWFKAAELAIVKKGAILNTNTVKLLAADAYRQESISSSSVDL